MVNPEIIPATKELVRQFYGKDLDETINGFVLVKEGETLAVSGVYISGERTILFSDVKPVVREKYKKTGVKLAYRVMKMIRQNKRRVIAVADNSVTQSYKFLEKLGFKPIGGIYLWQC